MRRQSRILQRSLQNYFASAPLFALIADEELENNGDDPAMTPPR